MSETNNLNKKVDDAIELLMSKEFYIDTLDKYPSSPVSKSDTTSKGAVFVRDIFKGEIKGLYFAHNTSDVMKDGKFLTKKEYLASLKETLLAKVLYDGEGSSLDRIATMKANVGTKAPSPVAFYLQDEGLTRKDITVVNFAIGLTSEERKSIFEKPFQDYTSSIRSDGKRFALADYSSSNGENGTKSYSMETEIMSWASLSPEVALKRYAQLEEMKKKSMAGFMASNSTFFLSSTVSGGEQISTN
jgi:hypothetical protein